MTSQKVPLLNSQSIIRLISPSNGNKIHSIEVLDSIGSTNDYLIEKYNENPISVAICLAEEQTLGRGTNNKPWSSPNKKGIYLSFSWQITKTSLTTSPVSIIVGAAAARALSRYNLKHNITLKWPNDLYVNGKKLGGILVEGYAENKDTWHIIIGIGINIYSDDSIIDMNKIALQDITDENLDRNEIIADIINECISTLEEAAKKGLNNITSVWNSYDMLKDKHISIMSAGSNYKGKNLGICNLGKLNLLVKGSVIKFTQAKIIEYTL